MTFKYFFAIILEFYSSLFTCSTLAPAFIISILSPATMSSRSTTIIIRLASSSSTVSSEPSVLAISEPIAPPAKAPMSVLLSDISQ